MNRLPLQDLQVGIVGASIAGLLSAQALSRQGARVQLFERSLHLAERGGSGIMLDAEVASSLGGLATRTHSLRRVLGSQLQTLWTRPVRKMASSWGELYRCLRTHVDERLVSNGVTVTGCQADGTLHFQTGPERRFDLVIGADGLGSTVRGCLGQGFEPGYCGYLAIRGMSEPGEWTGPFAGELLNVYGRNCHGVLYAPAGSLLNWMCYCNVADPTRLLTDEQGVQHRWSLPPHQMTSDLRRQLVELVSPLMPARFVELIEQTQGIYLQAIYYGMPETFVHGRVALVGDAAHVSPPHLGAATSLAYADVHSLTHALSQGFSLESWGEKRRQAVRAELDIAYRLGQELQNQPHDWDAWTAERFEAWWQDLSGGRPLYFETRKD